MASAEYLKRFVNDRLTAVADEILVLFQKTVAEYEEELRRQRKMLNIVVSSPPVVRLQRILEHDVSVKTTEENMKKAMMVDEQPSLNQDRGSSRAQETPEPPQIKEQEEPCSIGELELKQEPVHLKLHSADGQNNRIGDIVVDWPPVESSELPEQLAFKEELTVEVQSSLDPDRNSSVDQQEPELPQIKEQQEEPSIKLPEQLAFKEGLTVEVQSSLDQDRNSSVDQQEPELPQVKEQQEEPSISEFGLKQEPEDLQLCSAGVEKNESENPIVDWNPEEPLQESQVKIPVITSEESEAESDLSLYPGVSHSEELKEHNWENAKSTRHKQKNPDGNSHKGQTDKNQNVTVPKSNAYFTADWCFKKIKCKSKVKKHRKDNVGSDYLVGKPLEFSSRGATSWHKTLQTTEKSYSCQDCGKSYSRKSNLKVHKRIHTGENPYVCLTCGKSLTSKNQLIEHERSHTGERPYVCQTCGRSFARKAHLKQHQQTHTGERPYTCQECNKSFSIRGTWTRHIQTHTGEKPHVCFTCGRSFARKSHVKRHQRTHTGERPYACQECNKSFSLKKSLTQHIINVHRLETICLPNMRQGINTKV